MKNLRNVFVVLISLLISCKKNDEYSNSYHSQNPCPGDNAADVLINKNLLNYCFKTGTYWVFIDSTNKVIDSTSVSTYSNTLEKSACGPIFEHFYFSTISHPSSKINNYELRFEDIFIKGGVRIYDPNKGIHYDSLFILNKYYKNVTKTTVEKDDSEGGNKSIYYINPEFGFLRIDSYDSNNTLIYKKLLLKSNIIN